MGRDVADQIQPAQLEAFLQRCGYAGARITALRPLGGDTEGGVKSYGYGRPLRIDFNTSEKSQSLVLRTMSPDPFGHNQRADRVREMVLGHDVFPKIPKHIQPIATGAFADDGSLTALPSGEPFLLTEYVEGNLYADDLHRLMRAEIPTADDSARSVALARYLAELHAHNAPEVALAASLHKVFGSGEGIFGLCDSYPADDPVLPRERLEALERAAIGWRWRLKAHPERSCRTHGDFHPFNILFRDGTDFTVLDCSRGGAGEAADDVTCLSLNYAYFALLSRGAFTGPLRQLWQSFWQSYLEASNDDQILTLVAPYFAWRSLVLASPVWYPNTPQSTRERLIRFVEALMEGARFDPFAETIL